MVIDEEEGESSQTKYILQSELAEETKHLLLELPVVVTLVFRRENEKYQDLPQRYYVWVKQK